MCCTGVTPLPDSAIAAGDPLALLAIAMLPLAAPLVVGANCTVSVRLCDGERVTADPPLKENFAPLKVILEMVKLELPVLLTAMLRDVVLPTVTLPKPTLEGFTESVRPAVTPVPLKVMVIGEFSALLASDRLPLATTAVVGWNCTLKVMDCPAISVSGRVNPVVLNPAPVTLALVKLTLALLVLVTCTV